MRDFTVVLLAAGKGTRMKSDLPKVLYPLKGQPLIYYSLKELLSLKEYVKQLIIVVGYKEDLVKREIINILNSLLETQGNGYLKHIKVDFVKQTKLLGTADAVKCAQDKIIHNNVLVMCADTPLIKAKTLENFIQTFLIKPIACAVITAYFEPDTDLGRIIRDKHENIKEIREKIDLLPSEILLQENAVEINSGIYCFNKTDLKFYINRIEKNSKKKEYFLTDIIDLLYNEEKEIIPVLLKDKNQILGINNHIDLALAGKIIQKEILHQFMLEGVNIIDPDSTFIDEGVKIGLNTTIFPFTFIEKNVIIGANCFLGPFVHVRKDVVIKDNSQLGNFLEICRSRIGKNVKIKHFAYLGDAQIEDDVNIGAGAVIANFDGKAKHTTIIKKGAFIGSDTVLVAPVKIGEKSVTGAGSIVTKEVKPNSLVVGVPARFVKNLKKK